MDGDRFSSVSSSPPEKKPCASDGLCSYFGMGMYTLKHPTSILYDLCPGLHADYMLLKRNAVANFARYTCTYAVNSEKKFEAHGNRLDLVLDILAESILDYILSEFITGNCEVDGSHICIGKKKIHQALLQKAVHEYAFFSLQSHWERKGLPLQSSKSPSSVLADQMLQNWDSEYQTHLQKWDGESHTDGFPSAAFNGRSLNGSVRPNSAPVPKRQATAKIEPSPVMMVNQMFAGIQYEETGMEGPPHDRVFTIRATLNGEEFVGSGKTKKQAKEVAAQKILNTVENRTPP